MSSLKEKARTFPLEVEPGSYMARCYRIIEIGTVEGEYKGQKNITRKIMFTWEIPDELREFQPGQGKKPVVISKVFSFYLTTKPPKKTKLREFIEGWIGVGLTELEAREYNVIELLGRPCVLTIIHALKTDGGKKLEITGCSVPMKSQVCPPVVNLPRSLTYDNFDKAEFDTLPDWLKKDMEGSQEYKHMMGIGEGIDVVHEDDGNQEDMDDDIKQLEAAIKKMQTFDNQKDVEQFAAGMPDKIKKSTAFREAYKIHHQSCLPF